VERLDHLSTPFPGSVGGRPFGSFALLWELPEEQRREVAWIEIGGAGTLSARGRQWCAGEPAYALDYELESSAGFVTERLEVRVSGGATLILERGRSPELDGVLDCDLGFSPLTNAMPVLRDHLQDGGPTREIDVAWVSVPDLAVRRDHQIYEPLGAGRLRFTSPEAAFERVIELTSDGFVRHYPDIAHLAAAFVRAPDGQLARATTG
jgi:hypothetical protein